MAALNFPTAPTLNQLYPTPAVANVPQYRWDGTVWVANTPQDALAYVKRPGDTMTGPLTLPADPTVALHAATKQYIDGLDRAHFVRRNRVVNGAMQISQENGNTAGSGAGYYPVDQWYGWFSGVSVVTRQRVAVYTPSGSNSRIRMVVTTIDASLTLSDHQILWTVIEGIHTVDFRYGTASAKQSILRFGWKSPAGTYCITVENATATRSYLANFTITAGQANTDTEQVIVIPGDTTGTWLADTGAGISIGFTIAVGPDLRGVAGWQAGNKHGTASNTNGVATLNNTFELFDVGLYLDVDNTGIPPKWEMPDPVLELAKCQRYYKKFSAGGALIISTGGGAAGATFYDTITFNDMRVAPTASFSSHTYFNCSGLTNIGTTIQTTVLRATITAASQAYVSFDMVLNSRM